MKDLIDLNFSIFSINQIYLTPLPDSFPLFPTGSCQCRVHFFAINLGKGSLITQKNRLVLWNTIESLEALAVGWSGNFYKKHESITVISIA